MKMSAQFVAWDDAGAVDDIPRPMWAAGVDMVTGKWELPEHQHRKCELIYTVRGILTCEVGGNLWTVPPQCALWIPCNTLHKSQAFGQIEIYTLFVDWNATSNLPSICRTMSVSPLLRELLFRVEEIPALYPLDGPAGRLLPVILDELEAAPSEDARVPLPSDPNLRRLVDMMMAAPGEKASLAEWAARCALSERTLNRRFHEEIGMSLGTWRRQLHVTLALQRMASGESVQNVAVDLGYESASSFITMFKKTLGKPPGRYFSERRNTRKPDRIVS